MFYMFTPKSWGDDPNQCDEFQIHPEHLVRWWKVTNIFSNGLKPPNYIYVKIVLVLRGCFLFCHTDLLSGFFKVWPLLKVKASDTPWKVGNIFGSLRDMVQNYVVCWKMHDLVWHIFPSWDWVWHTKLEIPQTHGSSWEEILPLRPWDRVQSLIAHWDNNRGIQEKHPGQPLEIVVKLWSGNEGARYICELCVCVTFR